MTAQPVRERDLRLDFFRGLAMFIILLAHTPGNGWTLWIPARFGFSDATEIFVFCSGMASALAFGSIFASRGWLMGTARVAFRVWQVYWAQIGMVLATVLLLYLVDRQGWGDPAIAYIERLPVQPLFEDTGEALLGLATLTWVPNYFDILPMYLVILAMIPAVMAVQRGLGTEAALALIVAVWLAANLRLLDLPSRPWAPEIPWFFNPFGWQIVFFTGFAIGMGWIRVPAVTPGRVALAAAVVLVSIPFAWFRIHDGLWLPDDWAVQDWIADARRATEPLWWKTWQGAARFVHFLAVAYLARAAVGPKGRRLTTGWTPPGKPSVAMQWAAGAVAVATIPWAWLQEIATLPALDAWLLHHLTVTATAYLGGDLLIPGERIGMLQLAHLIALTTLGWAAIGPAGRAVVTGAGFVRLVPVIRKVGTQSLAVFLVSMVLAQANGVILDIHGNGFWTLWVVNLWGFAVLVAVAFGAGWFRSQPWRARRAPAPEPVPGGRVPAG